MSLWGPGKSHCAIKGHKKRINLNLVYNAMLFKLIHLACALELPASPFIPHPPNQSSLFIMSIPPLLEETRDAGTERKQPDVIQRKYIILVDDSYFTFFTLPHRFVVISSKYLLQNTLIIRLKITWIIVKLMLCCRTIWVVKVLTFLFSKSPCDEGTNTVMSFLPL